MQYEQYCRLHEARIKSQGVAPMNLSATELCIVCLDAEAACKSKKRGRRDFNKGLKVFIRNVCHAISMQCRHYFWQLYANHVQLLLQVISDMKPCYEPMMLQTCHKHLMDFQQRWLAVLPPQQAWKDILSNLNIACDCFLEDPRSAPGPVSSSGLVREPFQREAL